MATDHNFNKSFSQSQQITRREALRNLAALPLLAIAPMSTIVGVLPQTVTIVTQSANNTLLPQAERQARPEAYPDPDRTAAIDHWRAKFDALIIELEKVWTRLGQARHTPPAEVDTTAFIAQLFEAYEHAWQFVSEFETTNFDKLIGELAGREPFPVYLEYYLQTDGMSQTDFEREYKHLAQTNPAEAERLRALAEKKWGTL